MASRELDSFTVQMYTHNSHSVTHTVMFKWLYSNPATRPCTKCGVWSTTKVYFLLLLLTGWGVSEELRYIFYIMSMAITIMFSSLWGG